MRTRHYLTVLSGSSTYSARAHRCIPYIQRMSLLPSVFCWQRDVHARSGGRRINEPLLYMHHDSCNTSLFHFSSEQRQNEPSHVSVITSWHFWEGKIMMEYKTVQELWGPFIKCVYVCVRALVHVIYWGWEWWCHFAELRTFFGGSHNFKGLFEVNTWF